jgi:hypothetical protein
MDWNKKIYLSDILRVICGPFKPFMDHIRSKFDSFCRGWTNVVDIKWKGDHEDKFKEAEFAREYAKKLRRMGTDKRPIKPPPPPAPPKKRSRYYTESMDALDRAERVMNDGLADIDRKIAELTEMLERKIEKY